MEKKAAIPDIRVKSFITSLESAAALTVRGGTGNSFNPVCLSEVPACQSAACSAVVACVPPPPPPTLLCTQTCP